MDSWSEVFRIPATMQSHGASLSGINQRMPPPDISSLLFDTSQNLLWCGDSDGYTRSFTPSDATGGASSITGGAPVQLLPYTKFKSSSGSTPVLQYLNHRDGIFSMSTSNVNFNNRRGLNRLNLTADSFSDQMPSFTNLTCMTTNCNTLNDVVLGTKQSLLKFDVNKPSLISALNHPGDISMIKSSPKFLALGNANGSLELFDPVANKSIKSFQGHNGVLSDIDVQGTYIATCGYSLRSRRFHHNNHHSSNSNNSHHSSIDHDFIVDPLINIYDVRMMRPIAPYPFPAGASSIRFHPKLPNIIVVSSATGQIQFVDIYDQTNVYFYQADLGPPLQSDQSGPTPAGLSNLEVSENGDFLCFSDTHANLHLWSLGNSSNNFLNFPAMIEQPDLIMSSEPHIPVDDYNIPLNVVGMPYYKDLLLSNWASDLRFTKELAKLPDKSANLDGYESGFIPFDKLKFGPANVVKSYKSLKEGKSQGVLLPKFLSEQSMNKFLSEDDPQNVFQYKPNPNSPTSTPPNCYAKLQIQYSKFGVKDFDFNYYNKTQYCGLENHTDNSYINSLLQLYRFQPAFYNTVTKSLAKEWLPSDLDTVLRNPQGSSVLNELGYLFDMMYKAREKNVKISNFSQVLSNVPQAAQLVNINECATLNSNELRAMGINFNKYLISQLHTDLLAQFQDNSLERLMKIDLEVEVKSSMQSCPMYNKQPGASFSLDLITPPSNVLNKLSILLNPHLNNKSMMATPATTRKTHNLITYLEYSINQVHSVPCMAPHRMVGHNLEVKTSVTKLPPLLNLNLNLSSEEFKLINSFKKWLVPEFYSIWQPPSPSGESARLAIKSHFAAAEGVTKYDLVGYVCEISHHCSDLSVGSNNLVSYVRVGSQWLLFNDFLVMPIAEDEVFNLSYSWKKPITLLYQATNTIDFEYYNSSKLASVDDSILYRDHFANGTIYRDHFAKAARESHKQDYELLTRSEAPEMGSLVAIDAEFVTLKPEELEVRYDGTRKLIKPKQLSLARLSVLRGQFNKEGFGTAFIDDFIVHTVDIHDYTTSFSGIEPGDLDLNRSTKNLVTLQTAYRKLWLLLNMGVVFIGHGLFNDFRCINLQVPPEQIRDTAEFYYKSDFKRQLSLKFLSFCVLRTAVQTGNHDSIEDAYSALMLYKKYLELKATGEFDSVLHSVYSEGQLLRFKVPE